MNILEILENKKQCLLTNKPLMFTADEMNILCDPAQIRTLKMRVPMPDDFVKSFDAKSCLDQIYTGDSIYRVLEYCILTNRALCSIKQYIRRLN